MPLSKEIFKIVHHGTAQQRKYICEKELVYFAIFYFPEFFTYKIAPYQYDFYEDCKKLISGELDEAAWIAFAESAKTSIAKIFVTWCICYSKKRYINYDSYDKGNSEVALFNIVLWLQTNQRLIADFGQLYYKKRSHQEASMKRISNFVTENGIKVEAFSTQESPRGRVFNHLRPDLFILDDIENNITKESYPITKKIKSHIDEIKRGLSGQRGAVLYLGNLITEEGVIAHVMETVENNPRGMVRNIPVIADGKIAWPDKYVKTNEEAAKINATIENKDEQKISLEAKKASLGERVYETEMMNNPGKSGDLYFNRNIIRRLLKEVEEPLKEIAGLKIWRAFNAAHKYGQGGDTSEGKGLDANALTVIDYSTRPAVAVATFEDNLITPYNFAHEMKRAGLMFGECIACPEMNNTGFGTLAELLNIYDNIYIREDKKKVGKQISNEYGLRMMSGIKYDLFGSLREAIESGALLVLDAALLWEMYYYRKQDLNAMKIEEGMTRHFDKLTALAIAWEMRKYATPSKKDNEKPFKQKDMEVDSEYYG
ncbi:MAG: hypothetical protein WC619_01930 [Patescibacteria group bacterium]